MAPDKCSKCYALIPAAGSSRRMGGEVSKCLLSLSGTPVIGRTIATLRQCPLIEGIVVLIREAERAAYSALFSEGGVHFTEGGETRAQSVRRGLVHLKERMGCAPDDLVLVHDGARCLVSLTLVQRCVEAAREHSAVSAAVPSIDSVKLVGEGGRVVRSLPRENLVLIQTPQVFRFDLLWEAHQRGDANATDDAFLVERLHPVFVVTGERSNIKITTPEDLPLAEALLQGAKSISRPS